MAQRIGDSWSALTVEQNQLWDEWFNKHVPSSGKASSVGGEILRAMSRLIYRFYNDGDMAGRGYGRETCSSSAQYLRKRVPRFVGLCSLRSENTYESVLLDNEITVFHYLFNNQQLFETANDDDSR